MERTLILSSALAMLLSGPACAVDAPAVPAKDAAVPAAKEAPAKNSSLSSWFKHWQQALKKSAVESRYRKVRTTSVAAVRGAGQKGEDPKMVAWKGGWSEKKAAERTKNREELSAAVDLILEGKTEEAQAALDAFEKNHPNSSLLADVREAKAKLREMRGEPPLAAEPAAAPVAPAEVKSAAPTETKAPEAKPAEVKAPEAPAPETKAPEAKPVETKAPEAKPEETKAPEAKPAVSAGQ